MLDAIPDLRETLNTATPEELTAVFRAFDASITYDKPNQFLDLSAAIMPELLPAPQPTATAPRSGQRRG
jgi:hypothetical protein